MAIVNGDEAAGNAAAGDAAGVRAPAPILMCACLRRITPLIPPRSPGTRPMPRILPILLALTSVSRAAAEERPPAAVGVVSHIQVLSDKVPDVSSIEAWKRSFLKDGMS